MEDQKISEQAYRFVSQNREVIIKRFADSTLYAPSDHPVTLFMAGSPGAGKTETSQALIDSGYFVGKPMRIDADEIREMIPGYDGAHADLYQHAANRGVHFLYDHALQKANSCILDGTFAYGDAQRNVERSLKRGRKVIIYYVHQDLRSAWEVTKAREAERKRHVPREVFVRSAVAARQNVATVKTAFGEKVELTVMVKNIETETPVIYHDITFLDPSIVPIYTVDEIKAMIE